MYFRVKDPRAVGGGHFQKPLLVSPKHPRLEEHRRKREHLELNFRGATDPSYFRLRSLHVRQRSLCGKIAKNQWKQVD